MISLIASHCCVVQNDVTGGCDGMCTITLETRAFCKSCRLQKCFRCGMKKELILSELNYVVRPTLHVETPAQAACMLDPRIHRIFRRTSCSW